MKGRGGDPLKLSASLGQPGERARKCVGEISCGRERGLVVKR